MVALLALSIAAIFIVARFYSNRVQTNIDSVSLLKDSTYVLWGSEPNRDNNEYTHSYWLYNYTGEPTDSNLDSSKFKLVDVPLEFNYAFEYAGATFAQGNVGEISFKNKWQLRSRDGSASAAAINSLNLGLNKVFYQFNNLPIQRKFPVLFNTILESMKQQFLRQFFTEYLFKFLLKD